MNLNIHHLPQCSPHACGASTELSRIVSLESPTLITMQPNKSWVVVFNDQIIDQEIDRAGQQGRDIELVRIWTDVSRYHPTLCPSRAICWSLHTPVDFMPKADLYHHTCIATVEALRAVGVESFLRAGGYPAARVVGEDRVLAGPPAISRHGEWYSTFAILWWSVDVRDLRIIRREQNPCIMRFDDGQHGYAGVDDTGQTIDPQAWLGEFGAVLSRRLGLDYTPTVMPLDYTAALDGLTSKLSGSDWTERGIHPEMRARK